jgi:transglutaminase-like putative cysteine protease
VSETTQSPSPRVDDARPIATLALALLTTATVISLCRIFPGWEYLQPMLVLALGMHALAFVLRVARVPLLVALPVLLGGLVLLMSIVYYRDTMMFIFPSGRTFELMRADLQVVLDQFATAVSPVEGSFVAATAAVVGLSVILSDTFAFRAMGRIEAVVPSGVLFVFTSALGADRNRIVVAALWIGVALLTIATLRFSHADTEGGWMGARRVSLAAALPAIALVVGVSAVAAYAVGPRLPGAGEKALIETKHRRGSETEVLSPLVDIRARLTKRGNSELFTVSSSDSEGHYWRLTSLPDFDGDEWRPLKEDIRALGDRTAELNGERVQQRFTIKKMRGKYTPSAYSPATVQPSSVLWAGQTESLIVQNGLSQGDVIVVAAVLAKPTLQDLATATVGGADPIYTFLPPGVPDSARNLAREVTAAATTPFDRAVALQNWFRDNFTYNTNVQLDDSNNAIDVFLRDREGFCQQFAGTYAVMARALGLPSRVAVGYTPGELGSDGLFHVFGRHAHAWPEVWFDGIGWVAFEPTPQRGNGDTSQFTGVAAAQASPSNPGNGNTDDTTPTTVRDPNENGPTTTRPTDGRPQPGVTTTVARPGVATGKGTSGSSSSVAVILLSLIVLAVLWVLLMPRLLAAMTRRGHRSPRERVISAWHRSCHELSLAGAPPVGGRTPLEYVAAAEQATGVNDQLLRELAQQVTRAVYSRGEPDDRVAERCETLEHEVTERCKEIVPWSVRLRGMIDPRMMRRRLAV